jgi:hypothetical protein
MEQQEWSWFYAMAEDAESFHSAASREDAIKLGMSEYDEQFFVCEARRAPLKDDIFSADYVLELFEERNEESWGEDGADCKASSEQVDELISNLDNTFAAWRAKYRPYTAYCLTDFRNCETITVPASS